jgi:integrase
VQTLARIPTDHAPTIVATDADATDAKLLEMWLHGRAAHTIRAYRADVGRLLADVGGKPLRTITLADLQRFADSLTGAESSRGRVLASVKSLLSFAAKLGAMPFNVGAALRKPKARDTLADRILDEQQVARMLALSDGRDHALVRLAYAGGFRVSELVALRWSDCADAADGCMFATVFGKGGKTRVVRISAATSHVLRALRADAPLIARLSRTKRGFERVAGMADRAHSREARQDRKGRLPALSAARARIACAGTRRESDDGARYPRAFEHRDHRPLRPRAAGRIVRSRVARVIETRKASS